MICRCGRLACDLQHQSRVQITSRHSVVADEVFDSSREAERFVTWWFSQHDLPLGGALQARADLKDMRWRQPDDGLFGFALVDGARERFEASRLVEVA